MIHDSFRIFHFVSIQFSECSAEVSLGKPVFIGERKNSEGCAYLDGGHWHVCEMSHGYTMLSFKGNRRLNSSETRAVQFLPYPFDGTVNFFSFSL